MSREENLPLDHVNFMIGTIGTVADNKPHTNVNCTLFNCATQKSLFQDRTIRMIQILLFFYRTLIYET